MSERLALPRHGEEIVRHFQATCAAAGLKVTPQRLAIYRELVQAEDHPSAEMLFGRLRPAMPSLSLDTVYRTLATLEKNRLIQRVQTVQPQTRYEADISRHHHFICRCCARVVDFAWPALDQLTMPAEVDHFGLVLSHTVTVTGICQACRTTAANGPAIKENEPCQPH